MGILLDALELAIFVFMLALFARVALGLVMMLARDWRPAGVALVAVEAVFTVTDPPIKAVRKLVPPLTLGQVQLDLAFLIVFVVTSFVYRLVAAF